MSTWIPFETLAPSEQDGRGKFKQVNWLCRNGEIRALPWDAGNPKYVTHWSEIETPPEIVQTPFEKAESKWTSEGMAGGPAAAFRAGWDAAIESEKERTNPTA